MLRMQLREHLYIMYIKRPISTILDECSLLYFINLAVGWATSERNRKYNMAIFYIYGITRDDGDVSDPDAAIDKYYYIDSTDDKRYWDYRQNVVDKVKNGSVKAYTYRNGTAGSLCEVRESIYGTEFLKTLPNSDPADNISSLPEM